MIRDNLIKFRISVDAKKKDADSLIRGLPVERIRRAREMALRNNLELKYRTLDDVDLWRLLGFPDAIYDRNMKAAVMNQLMEVPFSTYQVLAAFKHDYLANVSGNAISEALNLLGLWDKEIGLETLAGRTPVVDRYGIKIIEEREDLTTLEWKTYMDGIFTIEVYKDKKEAVRKSLRWFLLQETKELIYPFLLGNTLVWRY